MIKEIEGIVEEADHGPIYFSLNGRDTRVEGTWFTIKKKDRETGNDR
jgi:hypothetical protein